MTTNATSLLGLALPVTGELSGTWGDVVNSSITALLDSAIAGTTTLSVDADVTLTTTALASNQAREAVILWTAGGTATRYITAPAQSKTYVVINNTSSTQSIVIRGAGPTTGVTVLAGRRALVAWDGTDFVEGASGNVVGAASSTDNAVARFDGTSGEVVQNSLVTISDTGVLAGVTDISGTPTMSSNAAGGVVYLDGAKALTAGGILTFDGTKLLATKVSQTSGGIGFGPLAGATSQGSFAVAIGNAAGADTQGGFAVAVGSNAGATTQGTYTVAIGSSAGGTSQGNYSVAIGRQAGTTTQGAYTVAVGYQAGGSTQGAGAVAIGQQAGVTAQGANAVAIGSLAGYTDQAANTIILNATGADVSGTAAQTDSFYVAPVRATTTGNSVLFYNSTTKEVFTSTRATANDIAIGNGAGSLSGSLLRVAIGTSAGATSQGSRAVAIGNLAGQTSQGGWGIAIGDSAGNASQGLYSIAIGRNAASSGQGADAVAIGQGSGFNQGTFGVAIGNQAGASGQGAYAVAMGYLSGGVSQGASSVAIGDQAGYGGSQGYSISIGYKAGYSSLSSAANAIILNATGAELSGVVNQSNSFYVAPIRTDSTAVANSLRYNTTTKEITYTDTIGYAAGSGGTVTQLTSRTTGVTVNKLSGAITLFSAAGSATAATFTVTNSTVTAADTIIVNQKSGTNLYITAVTAVATGSFNITFFTTGGTATDAPVLNFNVIRGSTS